MIHLEPSLESDLSTALAEAANTPETADLSGLWDQAKQAIARVPNKSLRLQLAGDVLLKLAEICAARANLLLAEWDRTRNRTGTAITVESLGELLRRKTTRIDFSDLIAIPEHKYKRLQAEDSGTDELGESVAVPLDMAALLEAFDSVIELEANAQEKSAAKYLADEEDVAGWTEAIAQWMQQRGNSKAISLVQLQQELGRPMIEVWLGVLLSQDLQLDLEQRGEFYSLQGIWVTYSYTHVTHRV